MPIIVIKVKPTLLRGTFHAVNDTKLCLTIYRKRIVHAYSYSYHQGNCERLGSTQVIASLVVTCDKICIVKR